jgi:hypothetical protein
VQNLGRTLARNVRLTWTTFPVVTDQLGGVVWKSADHSVLFSKGIPSLAPGEKIETLFDHFPERTKQELPMRYDITITYDSFDKMRHYSELFDLDLDLYRGLTRVGRKDIHEVAENLEAIKKEIERWTSIGGVNVLTTDKRQSDRAEDRSLRLTKLRPAIRKDGYRSALRAQWRDFLRRHGLYFGTEG